MVSHSSSASFSSFSFSYSHFSHTSSSPSSSPCSSPDSPSSVPFPESSTIAGTPSVVPFLWEEKPGVLKQEMMQKEREKRDEAHIGPSSTTPSSWQEGKDSSDVACLASKKLLPPRATISSEGHAPLRPPPRLLSSSAADSAQLGADHALQKHYHHHNLSHSPVGKAMPSYSSHKRSHQRGSSLDDDPFWLAMVVCTNEGKGSLNGGGAGSGGGSGIAKKIQEHSLHFHNCMPHHALSSTRSSKDQGKARADRLHPTSTFEVSVPDSSYPRSINEKGARVADNSANKRGPQRDEAKLRWSVEKAIIKEGKPPRSATAQTHQTRASGSRSVNDICLAAKALKALTLSKAGLHSRCKDLLQQQASVDLSCGHAKKLSCKRKIPDLFGCKSDRPFQEIDDKNG